MKRLPILTAGLLAGAAALAPGLASAKIVELGQTKTAVVAPACPKGVSPAQCYIILTRTTAVQSVSDGVAYPSTVKSNGWVVAFTVGLSNLSSSSKTEKSYVHELDAAYGGTPQLALTVLKPGPKKKFTVVAQSQTFHLIPFLGTVLQEPLSLPPTFSGLTALPVKAGDVIGVTVPTWAPILSINLSNTAFAFRKSRSTNCTQPTGSQTAQLTVGSSARYVCSYTGTRVEYTATEITTTSYPKTYVHSTRR